MTKPRVVCLLLLTLLTPALAQAHPSSAEALRRIDERLESRTPPGVLYLRKGIVHRDRGELPASLTFLNKAAAITPEDPDVAYHRALTLRALGQPHQALDALEQALLQKGPIANIHWARGQVLEDLGRSAEALRAYEQTCDHAPNIEAWLAQGRLLNEQGAPRAALDALLKGVKQTSGASVLRVEAFHLAQRLNEPDIGVAMMTPLVEKSRLRTPWLLLRAEALQSSGKTKQAHQDRLLALADAERGAHKRPSALAFLRRAKARHALGDLKGAREDLKRSLRTAPHLPQAREFEQTLDAPRRSPR